MSKHKPSMLKLVFAFSVATCMFYIVKPGVGHAQSSNGLDLSYSECDSSDLPYYDARITAPSDTYDVFVKMGKRGQTATVNLYTQGEVDASCLTVGSTTANGDTWQHIGLWEASGQDSTLFQLSSELFNGLPDANRPTVMLVSHANPPCIPTTNCDTKIQGTPAFIVPTGTLLNEDTLHVTRALDPSQDTLIRVDYYSGGQFLYSKPKLEPFDLRYVPGGEHTLSSVMQYKSKQQVIVQRKVYVSFAKDFQNLLFRLIYSNIVWLQIVGIVIALLIISSIALAVIHAMHRRHVWKLNHGLIKDETTPQINPANLPVDYVAPMHYLHTDSPLMQLTKKLVPIVVILFISMFIITILDSYVIQIFRVDGASMQDTLHTNDKLVIGKLDQTFSTFSHREYVPKRGQIVVFHKVKSDAFKKISEEDAKDVFVVKRVIGLPGERVVVKQGKITIYNNDKQEGFNPDDNGPWNKTMHPGTDENLDITLGTGEIFVSGDNRPDSLDSRANGPVQLRDIVGRAQARILPLSKHRLL